MSPSSNFLRRAQPLLGTLVEIGVRGVDANIAINAAFAEIATVHKLMTFYEVDSDVSRINRAPLMRELTVDWRTWEVLAFAWRLHKISQGAFDITMAAALVKAGFLPVHEGVEPADPAGRQDDLLLLPDNQIMIRRRLWIDLGGIAKGYAVDRAVATLRAHGAESGIVNAGGDLRLFGEAQPVHVRHPEQPQQAFDLGLLEETAIASSSGMYSSAVQDGCTVNPLVGRDRRCRAWRQGVTVIAPTCMTADALTKAVRLAPRRAPLMLKEFDAQALLLHRSGKARLLRSMQQ